MEFFGITGYPKESHKQLIVNRLTGTGLQLGPGPTTSSVLDAHVSRRFRVQWGPDGTGRARFKAFSCTVGTRWYWTRTSQGVFVYSEYLMVYGVWSLPSIHLRHPQQGFCGLAAGIASCGCFLLAVSTENDRYTHYRWIGGRIADAPIFSIKNSNFAI